MAPTFSSSWATSSVAAHQTDNLQPGSGPLSDEAWLHIRSALRLSDRELGIVQQIFAGSPQENIAGALAIAPDIVYRTTQRIYIKLHIGSRMELKSRVMAEHLIYLSHQPQRALTASAAEH
jgi:ATP/maltotriose-dependent transcriptional regulator MalT